MGWLGLSRALLIASAAIVLVGRTHASPAPGPEARLEAGYIFQSVTASDPRLSPDGRFVLYTRSSASADTDSFQSRLWIVATDGSSDRPLEIAGLGTGSTGDAQWSPHGELIAVVVYRGEQTALQIVDASNGGAKLLKELDGSPSGLAWSPDGKRIALTLPVQRPGTTDLAKVLPTAPTGHPWTAKPQVTDSLVYRSVFGGSAMPKPSRLFVLTLASGELQEYRSGAVSVGGFADSGYLDSRPSWSPDGRYIFISGRSSPDGVDLVATSDIFRYDVATADATRLTSGPGRKEHAEISPDGRWIAFLGTDPAGRAHPQKSLRLLPAAGGTVRLLTEGLDRGMETFAWSQDSRSLVVGYENEGVGVAARVDLKGRLTPFTRGVGASDYAYLGDGMSFSTGPAGMVTYPLQRRWSPGDIALWSKGKERLLTDLNAPLYSSRRLGETRERWFRSSFDGHKIQSFVVLPPDFDPSRKYPLILEIHGGPAAAWGGHFDYEKQRMAAAGYVVLLVNPRGSTGFGQSFTDAIDANFPGDADTADLLSGVDDLLREGWIDPSRLYVSGGSGGGTLTAWLIAKTNRFRAAAAYYMVSDWISHGLTTDMARRWTLGFFKRYPWDAPELYWQHSPLRLVGQVSTPTLLMVGDQDWRTNPAQTEMYFAALRMRGVEARLVRFLGGTHGLGNSPSERMAKVGAIIDWFDSHGGRIALLTPRKANDVGTQLAWDPNPLARRH